MAKRSGSARTRPNYGLWLLAIIAIGLAAAFFWNRQTIDGYASAGTAYAARIGCSCRFVAGRELDSCKTDLIAGMELISLSEDEEAKSVTASYPLIRSDTASYREGYGCVLEKWDG